MMCNVVRDWSVRAVYAGSLRGLRREARALGIGSLARCNRGGVAKRQDEDDLTRVAGQGCTRNVGETQITLVRVSGLFERRSIQPALQYGW